MQQQDVATWLHYETSVKLKNFNSYLRLTTKPSHVSFNLHSNSKVYHQLEERTKITPNVFSFAFVQLKIRVRNIRCVSVCVCLFWKLEKTVHHTLIPFYILRAYSETLLSAADTIPHDLDLIYRKIVVYKPIQPISVTICKMVYLIDVVNH